MNDEIHVIFHWTEKYMEFLRINICSLGVSIFTSWTSLFLAWFPFVIYSFFFP